MRKIPSLFVRDIQGHGTESPYLVDRVTPGCEWVLNGEGIATIKRDGTAVMIQDGIVYSRLDCKLGKTFPPEGAIPCQEPDINTGHWPHWVIANRLQDKWIREAVGTGVKFLTNGTYEACGPRINGNHDGLDCHILFQHGKEVIQDLKDLSFDGIRVYFIEFPFEGIVFHHPDGRMCKVTKQGFGLKRNIQVKEE